ncbi:hypothetical protein IC582_013579 [Cucumis melo]
MDIALGALREHLRLPQDQMKKYADRKRRDVEYQVGELVFLKIRPYKLLSLRRKRNEKLSPKFFEPHKLLERIGFIAYKLELPDNTSIHHVFHVSQLKKLVGEHTNVRSTIQYLNENYEWKANPEEVLGYQKNKAGNWEVLQCWEGLLRHKATWEIYEDMQGLYLDLHLEDKVNQKRGVILDPLIDFSIVGERKGVTHVK